MNGERELYSLGDSFQNSLVEINAPKRKAIGCFVTADTILTCFHVFKDTDPESIEIAGIYGENRKHKILSTSIHNQEYSEIDLMTIEVKVDGCSNLCCVELALDSDFKDSNDFYIYRPSSNKYDLIPVRPIVGKQQISKHSIFFADRQIETNLSGCPLIDKTTGKVCGIVSQTLNAPYDRDRLSKTTVYVIPITEIANKIPQIEEKNHYIKHVSCNLPDRNYDRFIGRELELKTLLEYVSPQHRQHLVVLDGAAGIGKTALAVECAYRCLLSYQKVRSKSNIPIFDAVVFISLKNNANFIDRYKFASKSLPDFGLSRIIRVIGDTLKVPDLNRFYESERFDRVYEALSRKTSLLIVDGLDDFTSDEANRIFKFLNNVPYYTKVIITTRQEGSFYSSISLKSLTDGESAEFIRQQTDLKDLAIQKMLGLVRGIPIVLTYAIEQYRAGNLIDYRKLHSSGSMDLGKFYFDRLLTSTEVNIDLLTCLSFFATSASLQATISVTTFKNLLVKAANLDDALFKLQQLKLVSKSKSKTGQIRYSILPITREYTLDRLASISALDPTFEREARSRWVDWYRDFVKNTPDELEAEWENICEVLMWCEIERDYDTIKEIWLNIDRFIKNKQYWTIRFYWWQYLAQESQQRGETKVYVSALVELIDTCLEMGDKKQARKYLDKASTRFKFVDKSVQERLKESEAKLEPAVKNVIDVV